MEALPDDQIEITSKILLTEARSPVSQLDADTSRSKDLVTICSMCKKIQVSPGQWFEIEEGLARLKVFEAEKMPQLTHGLCPSCHHVAMGELSDFETHDMRRM